MTVPFSRRSPTFRVSLLTAAALLVPGIAAAQRYPDPATPTNSFVFLYGNPTVNGAPLDAGDEIAAYSVHPKPGSSGKFEKVLIGHGVVSTPGQLDTTPAYGDDPGTTTVVEGAVPGEEICLVLWRASEGKEYTAYLVGSGAGKVNWTANLADVPVNVNFVEGQRIPLRNNAWNLFAYSALSGFYNVTPTQPQLDNVFWYFVANLGEALPLQSIAGKYDRVIGNDGTGAKFWNPALPGVSTLKSMSPGYGYWIKMKPDPGGLPLSWMTFPGARSSGSESLSLGTGWILLGYWGAPIYHLPGYDAFSELYPVDAADNVTVSPIGQLWSAIDGKYVRITSFDATGAKLWNPSLPAVSTLKHMGPGYGYWVKMSAAGALVLPSRTVPAGVRAVAGDNAVTVSWLQVPGASSYNIYWGTSPGVTKGSAQVPGASSPYDHAGRVNGTTYYYIVTAVVGGTEGNPSAEVSATPAASTLAPVITTFTPASGIPGDNVTIVGENFTAGATTVSFFNGVPAAVLSNTGTVLQVAVPFGAATGPITVTNPVTTTASATPFTVITVPPPPTGVTATAGIEQATLTWNPSAGATSYRVYWANTPNVSKVSYAGMIDNAVSPLVHSPLTAGVPYYYVVTARNVAGESAESSPMVSALPVPPPIVVTVSPDNVTLVAGQAQQFIATVQNASNPSVSWTVLEGSPGAGTVSGTGFYVAPSTPGTYHVRATSVQDPTRNATATITVIPAIFSVSGTVSYAGPKSGRIYINVLYSGGGEANLGTSVSGPGQPYTIRGLSPGSYNVVAFLDNVGTQVQTVSSPVSAPVPVTITSGNVPGVGVTLTNPVAVSPSPPSGLNASPGNGCALVFWDVAQDGNGVAAYDYFNVYWSTDPAVSPTNFTGSRTGIPVQGDMNLLMLRGLGNGSQLYFVITSTAGGVTSAPSPAFGPVTIGSPAGGQTVSGTVSFPGIAATGPLHIMLIPSDFNGVGTVYIASVATPAASPQAYSIPGVPNGSYWLYPVLDQNGNGIIDVGDIFPTESGGAPLVTVAGAPVTANATLAAINADAYVEVDHGTAVGGGEWYNLGLRLSKLRKLPVRVAVTAGPNVAVPSDIGLNRWGGFHLWRNTSRPNVGDVYAFFVTYSDNTSETLNAPVTAVLDSFGTPTFPVGAVTGAGVSTPTFTWTPPASPPASYTYQVLVSDASHNMIWESWGIPAGTTSIPYNSDGSASVYPLVSGNTYYWEIVVEDNSGNKARRQASFVPIETGPVMISFTGKVTDMAGAAIQGALAEMVGNPARNATTAADGTFTVTGLPSGTLFTLKVSRAGYLPVYSGGISSTSSINATNAPFTLYTPAQVTAMGLSPGKGVVFGRTLNGSNLAPLSGVAVTATSALHPAAPYAVDYYNGSTFVGGSTFANGIFRVLNVDGNDVVTAAGFLSGWNFQAVSSPVRPDAVTEVALFGTPVTPPPGYYTVSGTVSYGGTKPGRIYIRLEQQFGGSTGYGTSIAAPGLPFTIRGVPPGTYRLLAWKDSLGTGIRNGTNPIGVYDPVTVTSSNVTGVGIAMNDASSYSPIPPPSVNVTPGDGNALVFFDDPFFFDPMNNTSAEAATTYNIYWSTSSLVSPTNFTGSRTGIPAQDDGHYFLTGFANGTTLYFVVTASANGQTSAPSPVSAPVTIGVPAGGHSVSGTVSFSGVTPTGPLYIAVGNDLNGYRLHRIASPANPQSFTVPGVPDGTYWVLPFVDMNNSSTIDRGDLRWNDRLSPPPVTVAGADVVGANATLSGVSGIATANSQHGSDGASQWYSVGVGVDDMRKTVAKVTVVAGPNVPVPLDLGRDWREHRLWKWLNTTRPNVGDTYAFDVTYDDGATQTLTTSIMSVIDTLPLPQYPIGNISGGDSLKPTFRWDAPYPAPSTGYTYSFLLNEGSRQVWWPEMVGIPSTQTTLAYNFDGSSADPQLGFGSRYRWDIKVVDAYGNEGVNSASFTPVSGSMGGTPNAPSQLTAVGLDGSVQLRWFNNAGGYPQYRIYRGTTPGGPKTLVGATQNTGYADKGVVNGTTYYYKVSAMTEFAESAQSNEAAATPQANVYQARTGYVQRRPGNVLRYYIDMKDPVTGEGIPVGNLDNTSVTITGPGGVSVPISTRNKWVSNFAPLEADGTPQVNTGSFGVITGSNLPTGFYVVRMADTLGRNYAVTTWFDNSIVNPTGVDNTTMSATYTAAGGLQLSWSKQAGLSTANYPGGVVYRAVAYTRTDHNADGNSDAVYYSPPIQISDGQSSYTHTIDNASLGYLRGYQGGFPVTEFFWNVETRVQANGSEVYRTISGNRDFPGSQVVDRYLQLRKYADGQQVYRIWAQVSRPFGVPMTLSELTGSTLSLLDGGGNPVPLAAGTTKPYYTSYYILNAAQPGTITYSAGSGLNANLVITPVGTLPAGNYTIRLTDGASIVYSSTVNYPGDEVLPAVDNAAMWEVPNPDGSVTLYWPTPAGMDSTMQFRAVVSSNAVDQTGDGQSDERVFGNAGFVSPGATNILVVPSSVVGALKAAYPPGELRWHVQTRKVASGNNYSRTLSGTRVFPTP